METFMQLLVMALCLSLLLVIGIGIAVWLATRASRPNVLTVMDGEGKPIGGVPFYAKRSRRVHQTVYLETLADVTLTLMKTMTATDGKESTAPVLAATRTISLTADNSGKLAELQAAVTKAQGQEGAEAMWEAVKDKFNDLPEYTGLWPAGDLPVVLNTILEESYVDYENQFTINGTMPLIGSAELSADLTADGTLSKTTGKAEDSTLTTLLGALPKGDLASLLKTDKPDTSQEKSDTPSGTQAGAARFDLQLMVERHYTRHWLSEPPAMAGDQEPIELSRARSVSYRRETGAELPLTKPPAPQPEMKEEEASAS